jgi:hypothetical protein
MIGISVVKKWLTVHDEIRNHQIGICMALAELSTIDAGLHQIPSAAVSWR